MCVERTQYCDEYRHLKDWVLLLRVNTKALDYIWERIIYVLSFIHVSNNENEIEAYTVLLFIESKNCTNSFCFLVHLIVVLSLRQLASIWINIKSINLKIRRKTEAYLEKIDFRFFAAFLSDKIRFYFE